MSVIGIVGGIGPESTIDYYRTLLARLRERGALAETEILIDSISVDRVLALAGRNDREELTQYLLRAVQRLSAAGADLALLASNTPHIVFDELARRAPIPLVSIVMATCEAAQAQGLRRVGLLGTRFTMEGGFYPAVFAGQGIEVVVPDAQDRGYVHDRYVTQLVPGIYTDETRAGFLAVMDRMRERERIEGVVLGGTELPMLLRDVQYPVPLLDTTRIHVEAVVAAALAASPAVGR